MFLAFKMHGNYMFTLNHYSQQCIKNNARITDMTAEYNLVKFMQHLLTLKAVILIFVFLFFLVMSLFRS